MRTRDASDSELVLARTPRRIVSLVPSLTETLFALGVGAAVVGVTQFCEEPATAVATLPKVGGTKTPSIETIVALKPDLVIASTEENRAEDVAALRARGVPVFVTFYPTVAAALDGIAALAAIVGVAAPAWLQGALAAVAECAARRQAPVRYFCPIWRRPYMVARADTYMADLLALAGGVSAFPADGPAHYFTVALADLPAAAPRVILLPDEPYRFAPRHLADFAPYATVPALASNRVHFVDGKALTWYGPRIPAALRTFAAHFAGASGAAESVPAATAASEEQR